MTEEEKTIRELLQEIMMKNSAIAPPLDFGHFIDAYYYHRGLQWPNTHEAMMFAQTELGEVYELLLAYSAKPWVRNNPENKLDYSFNALSTELGDAIMMLQVAAQTRAGIAPAFVSSIDWPLAKLIVKLVRKLNEKFEDVTYGNEGDAEPLKDLPVLRAVAMSDAGVLYSNVDEMKAAGTKTIAGFIYHEVLENVIAHCSAEASGRDILLAIECGDLSLDIYHVCGYFIGILHT